MKKFVSTSIIILAMYLPSHSQLIDNFSDGEYHNSPTWEDPSESFMIWNGMLKLDASGKEGSSSIATQSNYLNNAIWEFTVKLEFNPSNYNYPDIYLIADDRDLKSHIFGYFVRIGGQNDEISLYRREGYPNQIHKIIDGQDNITDRDSVAFRIRVTRDGSGIWKLFYSQPTELNFSFSGEIEDTVFQESNYFGILCQYTSGRSDKFFFDDINISGQTWIDLIPPRIDTVYCAGIDRIDCLFSEKIKSISAKSPLNYNIEGVGMPDSIHYNPESLLISIFTHEDLIDGNEYHLIFKQIEDLAGNSLKIPEAKFIYHQIKEVFPGSVIINEIMADPTPRVLLPEHEYIELINTTNNYIYLNDCHINNKLINNAVLSPNGYSILCDKEAETLFLKLHCNIIGVSGWAAINNQGDDLKLTNQTGEILDEVVFGSGWYDDNNKNDGGWSLELVNPAYHCWGKKSWLVSRAKDGGTPGSINSVFSDRVKNETQGVWDFRASGKSLSLEFSDPLVKNPLTENFSIKGNDILRIATMSDDPNLINLTLHDSLIAGTPYALSIHNLNDCSKTYLIDTTLYIGQGITPEFLGTLITEVMVDEKPSQGLPETEYIELYNPGQKITDLSGCRLIIGPDTLYLPQKCLLPYEYRVICPDEFEEKLSCHSIGIPKFPVINNSGEKIVLQAPGGNYVFYLNFKKDWLPEDLQSGVSIEMIDVHNPCGQAGNWGNSSNSKGGTPGHINSIASSNPDNRGPYLETVSPLKNDDLLLRFSEPIHIGHLSNSDFTINDQTIVEKFEILDLQNISCYIHEPLASDIIYKMKVENVMDCAGNLLQNKVPLEFGLPSRADSLDIVINEVLFNPLPGGKDYIEIFNKSEKFIDLRNWGFSNGIDTANNKISVLSELPFIVSPGSYKAFTVDKQQTANDFPHANSQNIIQLDKMPVMNDDDGSVILLSGNGKKIDQFDYNEDYQFRLLNEKQGVSLERIDPNSASNDPGNWHSASEQSGFGTPGEKNSSHSSDTIPDRNVYVEPRVFSPDNSGIFDKTFIHYNFDKPGFVANLLIFDINGRMIRQLANNELLSASGYMTWDGTCDNGIKASIGYYIIFLEVFNLEGVHLSFKEKVAIGTRL